jgi:hypothetical protein
MELLLKNINMDFNESRLYLNSFRVCVYSGTPLLWKLLLLLLLLLFNYTKVM